MQTNEQTSPVIKCELRPYTSKQLYELYKVSDKTFRKWLLPFKEYVGAKNGFYYTISQVEKIFEKIGVPGCFAED